MRGVLAGLGFVALAWLLIFSSAWGIVKFTNTPESSARTRYLRACQARTETPAAYIACDREADAYLELRGERRP